MEKFGAGNTIYVNTIQAAMYVVFSDAYDGITCAYLNLVARSVFFHKFYMSMSIHFWALLALQISHSNLSNLLCLKKIEFAEEEVILCLKKVKENKFPSATSIFFKFPHSSPRLPAPPCPSALAPDTRCQ